MFRWSELAGAGLILVVLVAAVGLAEAGPMTSCAYFDRPDWAVACERNENCCRGSANWKTACDVFHVLAEYTAAASMLANSTPAGRHALMKNFAACMKE